MVKVDAGVVGRTAAVGAVTGGITGFAVVCVLAVRGAAADEPMIPSSAGFVLGGVVGAIIGLLVGLLAGCLLLLPAPWMRLHPVRARIACGMACAGAVVMPFLIAGFGWHLWPDTPVAWWAAGLTLYTGLVGAWKSRYILAGGKEADPEHQPAERGEP
ncbi:hypothetical protein AB0F72_34010 [Actinoplanes sp. NPDC023936]|uniref:hypothetical protein n=1 Tax=Actinoplanes sp. NPDC023936 TaxID=3154910 RepID=UPI00340B025D